MPGRWLNWIRGLQPARRELFLHEDDWGQIELLPAAAEPWCRAEMARIAGFAAAHAAPDGTGWTDVYVRAASQQKLSDLGISWCAAVDAIAAQLPAFDAVTSGTFSSPDPVARVRGFGPAHNSGVVLVPDATGVHLEAATLVLNGHDEESAQVLDAIAAVPAPSTLIVVDWLRGACTALVREADR